MHSHLLLPHTRPAMFSLSSRTQMHTASDVKPADEIAAVALPILAACLAEPTLSMIDTACVGRLAGSSASAGLAALSVNAAIFNLFAVCSSFLCTATTNVVGNAEGSDVSAAAGRCFRDGLVIAIGIGGALMLFALLNCDMILSRGFGLSRASPAYLPAARYLRVRALSLPASTSTLVAVGVCLGLQDSLTPLYGVLVAFAVNVFGDLLCVWRFGWGLTGAAIATTLAALAGCMVIGGTLSQRLQPRWHRTLSRKDLRPFVACSGALLAGTTLNAATYTMSSRVVAASGHVSQAAAHQIGLQGWWLLSFVAVPLSLAGQSLLPRRAREQPLHAMKTVRTLATLGGACALLMAASNALLTSQLAPFFSTDTTVLSSLRALTATAAGSQACISLATALDGVFIGCGWLRHYIIACALGTTASLGLMAQGMRTGGGLRPAWRGLLFFSALRLAAHLAQLPRLMQALATSRSAKGTSLQRMPKMDQNSESISDSLSSLECNACAKD